MRSAGLKILFLGAFLGVSALPNFSAWAAEGQPGDLNDVKVRLTAIEERQREILAKEDKILEELDRIRIWVHRK